jgi:hypothetical protein
MWDVGCGMSDVGCRMWDVGCGMSVIGKNAFEQEYLGTAPNP